MQGLLSKKEEKLLQTIGDALHDWLLRRCMEGLLGMELTI